MDDELLPNGQFGCRLKWISYSTKFCDLEATKILEAAYDKSAIDDHFVYVTCVEKLVISLCNVWTRLTKTFVVEAVVLSMLPKDKMTILSSSVAMNDELDTKFTSMAVCAWEHIIVISPSPNISVHLSVSYFFQHINRNIDMSGMHDRLRPDHGVADLRIAIIRKFEA